MLMVEVIDLKWYSLCTQTVPITRSSNCDRRAVSIYVRLKFGKNDIISSMENHFYKIPLLHLHYTYTILGLGLQEHLSEHNQINLTVVIDRTVVLFYQLRYFNLYLCRVIIFNQYLRISIFFASHHPCTVRFTYSDTSK